jgi:DNA-directed RNA polymerase sigma subunit (sigma70/sigma32)
MICGMPSWLRWAFEPSSLDAPLSGQSGAALLADLLGEEDTQMDHLLDMQAVATHWGELSPYEQKILLMHFYDGVTQDKIGQQLGISRMQVSRLFGYLRAAPSRARRCNPQLRTVCGRRPVGGMNGRNRRVGRE